MSTEHMSDLIDAVVQIKASGARISPGDVLALLQQRPEFEDVPISQVRRAITKAPKADAETRSKLRAVQERERESKRIRTERARPAEKRARAEAAAAHEAEVAAVMAAEREARQREEREREAENEAREREDREYWPWRAQMAALLRRSKEEAPYRCGFEGRPYSEESRRALASCAAPSRCKTHRAERKRPPPVGFPPPTPYLGLYPSEGFTTEQIVQHHFGAISELQQARLADTLAIRPRSPGEIEDFCSIYEDFDSFLLVLKVQAEAYAEEQSASLGSALVW